MAISIPLHAETQTHKSEPTYLARIRAGTAPKTFAGLSRTESRLSGAFGAEAGRFIDLRWAVMAQLGFLWVTDTRADLEGVEVDRGGGAFKLSEYGLGVDRLLGEGGGYVGARAALVRHTERSVREAQRPPLGWGARLVAGVELALGDWVHLGGALRVGFDRFPGRTFDGHSATIGFEASLSLY